MKISSKVIDDEDFIEFYTDHVSDKFWAFIVSSMHVSLNDTSYLYLALIQRLVNC